MANMCRQAGEHGKAYRVYAISAEHFAAADDTLAYAYALNNMAWEQAVMGHKDSALALVDSAVHCYPRSPLTEKVTETRAAACFFREDYDSVLYYTAPPANDYLLMLRAQAYSYLQQDDSATYYAQLLLPRTTDPFYLDDLYYILAHNDTSASKEDVLLVTSERVDVQQIIEARHGKLTQAVLLMEMDERGSHGPWIMTAYLLAVLISIGLSVWAIIIHRRHTHLHHELTQQEALRQHERERNIRLLREVPDIRKELPWDDYPALCRQIDKRFHGLADRLQAEGLNEQDVRLSLLVLLGMSHREMADILNCSPKSIGKLKDVTAHKLGISGGQLQQKIHTFA
jgi:DNA-binding CsgD family transcriptional regulator